MIGTNLLSSVSPKGLVSVTGNETVDSMFWFSPAKVNFVISLSLCPLQRPQVLVTRSLMVLLSEFCSGVSKGLGSRKAVRYSAQRQVSVEDNNYIITHSLRASSPGG